MSQNKSIKGEESKKQKGLNLEKIKEYWKLIRIFCSDNRKIFILIAIYFTFFLVVATIILILRTKPEGEVKVPDFLGKKFTTVYGSFERKGIKPQIKYYDTFDVEDGVILKQDPDPGSVVSEGDRIKITVSRNNLSLDTPSLIGKELPIAKNMLKNMHIGERSVSIGVGIVSYVPSDKTAENIVLDQSPKPGEKINPENKINILVSSGKAGSEMVMPEVTGQSIDLCFDLLLAKGVIVDQEIVNASTSAESGKIVSQVPAKGSPIVQGQTVKIKVLYYPKEAHFFYGYERLVYQIDEDEKEGLFEAYLEDYNPKRIIYSMKLKGKQTLQCVFHRTGNARISIVRNKKVVKVLSINVQDF